MPEPLRNLVLTTVAVAPSPADSGTTLTPTALPADLDPHVDGHFKAFVGPPGVGRSVWVAEAEIIRVVAQDSGEWTIERAVEGPNPARSIQVGDEIVAGVSAGTFDAYQPKVYNGHDRILVSVPEGDEASVWSVGIDGRGLVRVTPHEAGFYDYVGAFEPVERRKVMWTRFDNNTGRYDIMVIDTITGDIVNLTDGFNVGADVIDGAYYGAWSPDGRKIAFGASDGPTPPDGGNVWTMNADGSGKTKILDSPDFDHSNLSTDAAPAWSPDGQRIVIQNTDSVAGDGEPDGVIVCDADGGNPAVIVPQNSVSEEKIVSVAWSSRDKIAYAQQADGCFIVNPDGTGKTQVFTDAYYVSWSPDGSRLLIVRENGTSLVLDLDGGVTLLPTRDGYPINWGNAGDHSPWGSMQETGVPIVRGPFTVRWDDANLEAGIPFYTPVVGEVLLNAVPVIRTAWNGTTPTADIGTGVSTNAGLSTITGYTISLSAAWAQDAGDGLLVQTNAIFVAQYGDLLSFGLGIALSTNPLKVWVTQDGLKGGADAGATQGEFDIYLVTAMPRPL